MGKKPEKKKAGTAPRAAGPETPPILSGELKYFRLPEVLHLLSLQGLTGRLSISDGRRHVDIFFRGGDVAYATDEERDAPEQLGHLLVAMGRVTRETLGAVLNKCREDGRRLGDALVEDGLVPAADIHTALMKQTERSAYKAMAWSEGRFEFEACGLPEFIQDITLGLRVEGLILEGIRRVQEMRIVSEKIPRLDMVFSRADYPKGELERIGLKPAERRVLELVDGERDVAKLIKASGLGEFGLLRALYALYSVGIITNKAGRSDKTQYL